VDTKSHYIVQTLPARLRNVKPPLDKPNPKIGIGALPSLSHLRHYLLFALFRPGFIFFGPARNAWQEACFGTVFVDHA
jgi:hypothetical protein